MSIYENMSICDLRCCADLSVIREIELIRNVALLLLPKQVTPEVNCALHAIPKQNIAATMYPDEFQEISQLNGFAELNDASFKEDGNSLYLINGVAVFRMLSPETRGTLFVNGLVLFHESLRGKVGLTFSQMNGLMKYWPFEEVLAYQDDIEFDEATIGYLQPLTVLIVNGDACFANSVSPASLQEKNLRCIFNGDVKCTHAVAAYLKASSIINGSLSVID